MAIGKALLHVRHYRGLTQAQVCQRAGLTVSYLSRLENGHLEPTMGTLQRVADALETPPSKIFQVIETGENGNGGSDPARCPISSSGACIREQLSSRHGRSPKAAEYGPNELHLIRMADYLALHGTPEVRAALGVVLESLLQRLRSSLG